MDGSLPREEVQPKDGGGVNSLCSLSLPPPLHRQLEVIRASGQAAPRLVSEYYRPAQGFLLNGVSPAAALQLLPW